MRRFDLSRHGPLVLLALLVLTPLAIWAATSGGSDEDKSSFYIERSIGLRGEPELLITLEDPDVQVPAGRTSVEVECTDSAGKDIIKSTQPWPFPPEQGFAPHAHVAASPDDVQRAYRCRVIGTNKRLVANVQ